MNLAEVHESMKDLLYTEDDCKALDLILATYISRKQTHSKIWIILVAETGFGKSELTRPFHDDNIIRIRKLTPSTLVAGRNDNGKHDLAPKLKDKILLIPDLAQLLKLPTDTKAQLFSQLVDLYDGIATTNAYAVYKYYENLNVSFIGCSTFAIQSQFLLFSYLGTRFLCYNMHTLNREKLLLKIKENLETGTKDKKRNNYENTVKRYLKETEYTHHEIPEEIRERIKIWGDMLTRLRITGNTESTSGDLSEVPHDELPTRIIEQLETIYRSLLSLSLNYNKERAMDIIKNLVLSSTSRLRIKVLIQAIHRQHTYDKPFSRKEIAKDLNMGWKQIYRELNFLTHSELLNKNCKYINNDTRTGDEIYYETWKINEENNCIKLLNKHLGYQTTTEEEIKS